VTTVAATTEMQFYFDNSAKCDFTPQTIEQLLAARAIKKVIWNQKNWHRFVPAWKNPPEDSGEIGALEAGLVAPMLRPEALARQEQRKAQEYLKQELESKQNRTMFLAWRAWSGDELNETGYYISDSDRIVRGAMR
jgi:hypothetical protein